MTDPGISAWGHSTEQVVVSAQDDVEEYWGAKLEAWFVAEPAFRKYFEEVEEEGALPDLYGKSLLVSRRQFPKIHRVISEVSEFLGCEAPECFVYEGYRYLCDSEGLSRPRLELSARAVRDFHEDELVHLIAKETYHVAAGHLRREVMAEKMMALVRAAPSLASSIPGMSFLMQFGGAAAFEGVTFHLRNVAFNWYKHACFSADNFATAYTGDVRTSLSATLLTIFNERGLVEQLDVQQYLRQIGPIESMMGPIATLDKVDEVLPYGPYRLLNQLRYIHSARGRGFAAYCASLRARGGE